MDNDMQDRAAHLAALRARAQAQMGAIGVDEAFIAHLVETFYGRIADHPHLGPVFNARLEGRWPAHMAKMTSFWSSLVFRSGAYGGKPVQAHAGIPGMAAELFEQWLALFGTTLDDIAPSTAAKDWFMTTAERIARSLTLSLFYDPALDDPARPRR